MRAIALLVIVIALVGCGKRNGPIEYKMKTVHAVECEHKTFYVYVPDNTFGIRLDKSGKKLSSIPRCMARVIGRSNGVSGEIRLIND